MLQIQHGSTLKTLYEVKLARHKRTNTVWCHVQKKLEIKPLVRKQNGARGRGTGALVCTDGALPSRQIEVTAARQVKMLRAQACPPEQG